MSPNPRPFQQVDVFSPVPMFGNPVAVILDGEGLSDGQMLDLTRWTNLSEATFVLAPTRPDADYAVRIFTAAGELPFAGHPTLGTCHAWLRAGGRPADPGRIVQECPAGLVPLRRIDGRLAFEAPPLQRSGPVASEDLKRALSVLRVGADAVVDSQWLDNGPGWLGVLLESAEAVVALDAAVPADWEGDAIDIGIAGLYPVGSECAVEVRALFSDDRGRLVEDPVTGSLNASLGQWLVGSGRVAAPYVASQGTLLGRRGRAHISQDERGAIWVAGDTHTLVEGTVEPD